jgi:hypothetical protein
MPLLRLSWLPEWRATILLFSGVLYEQSKQKADAFVSGVLATLGQNASRAE